MRWSSNWIQNEKSFLKRNQIDLLVRRERREQQNGSIFGFNWIDDRS